MTAILILTAVAAVAVLAAVAVVVMGRGGQLARFEADHPPLDLPADRPMSGRDVARIRLPLALWGYHVRAVDELLDRVAASLKEREAYTAQLEARLAESGVPAPAPGPRVWYPRPPEEARHDAADTGPEPGQPSDDGPPVPASASHRDNGRTPHGKHGA